ncbi:hypothetical protein E7738_17415 [Pantoea sp. SGAir0430]
MKWIGFLMFLILTLLYLWNGKDHFNKKEWRNFIGMFFSVLIGAFLLVFVLVGISKFTPLMERETARSLAVIIPASFITMLLCKFLVVMLNAMFSIILNFHKKNNTSENYFRITVFFERVWSKVQMLIKALASLGCILMFYGIWFGDIS